jgi:pimeloyl-ACP methyl ester carboxylesterase
MTQQSRPLLAFAHANSYPAASYQPMLDALAGPFDVHAYPKLGHDPLHPVTDCWPALVREYETWLSAQQAASGAQEPWLLVGHSLGGFLSLLVAARNPQRVRGLILLDSPIVGGWQANLLHVAKLTGLVWYVSPARFANKRRDRFESVADAFAHFRGKGVFADFSDAALQQYLAAGLVSAKEGVKLAFDRRIEARIYATLPHHMTRVARKLKTIAPALPVSFIAGSRSAEVKQVGWRYTRWLVPQERTRIVEGTHLFPLERPLETAQMISELALTSNVQ